MDQFQGSRNVNDIGRLLAAAGTEHQKRHRRPDAFPPGTDQVLTDLIEQRFTGL